MIKTTGKMTLLLRLGRTVFACMPSRNMNPDMRTAIRPLVLGGFACWCDRSQPGGD